MAIITILIKLKLKHENLIIFWYLNDIHTKASRGKQIYLITDFNHLKLIIQSAGSALLLFLFPLGDYHLIACSSLDTKS